MTLPPYEPSAERPMTPYRAPTVGDLCWLFTALGHGGDLDQPHTWDIHRPTAERAKELLDAMCGPIPQDAIDRLVAAAPTLDVAELNDACQFEDCCTDSTAKPSDDPAHSQENGGDA